LPREGRTRIKIIFPKQILKTFSEGQRKDLPRRRNALKYEISPWGYVYTNSYTCVKCGTPMHDDHDRKSGITIYACFKCGNRFYPDYPKSLSKKSISSGEIEDLAAW
jgi:DNA-directed RNA polymerase subunit RPC12/RpoP